MDENKVYGKERRYFTLGHMILIALLCAVLGGILVFGAIRLFTNENTNELTNNGDKLYDYPDKDLVPAIAKKLIPSVVGIRTTISVDNIFMEQSQRAGAGTGVIISEDGYIITNNHVIADALNAGTNTISEGANIEVILTGQPDEPYSVEVIGRDERTDIAVIKIDAKGLPAAELGDSDNLTLGELAIAIGNPGGLDFMGTVSKGIISGLDRIIDTGDGNELSLIQTDTSINPGNSGGPLCNANGQVIGIINIKIVAVGFEGLGFAIPINQANEIAQELIEDGYIKGRPLLGISIDSTFTEDVAKQNDVPAGVLIRSVNPDSGAAEAGLLPNDIITKFEGEQVREFIDLRRLIDRYSSGDVVEIEVFRYDDDEYLTFEVTLMEDTGTSTN